MRNKNNTKASLQRGETVIVPEINRAFDPVIVEVLAQIGYGSVWIDMEHSHADLKGLSTMVLAADSADIDVFVRIPHGPYNQVLKTLEVGASGVIWPHCKNAAEARELVRCGKFRPLGLRGMGEGRDSGYGHHGVPERFDRANEETLLGVMIEDREGVEEAEAIAAVDGIDLLFVGPGDLSHSYGIEREPGPFILKEKILAAFDKVGEACSKHGKAMGTAVGPGEGMVAAVKRGTRWLNCSHEVGALRTGFAEARAATARLINR